MRAASFLLLVALALPAAADEVVARVGAAEVTVGELRSYLASLNPEERAGFAKDPSLLAQAVRVYLARRAVLNVAVAKKWDEEPAVKAQLDRVREGALTELYLQSVSRPPAGYPSGAEVQAAYDADANRAAFEVPRQYRVAQIFIAADSKKNADAIAKKLREPDADFAVVARAETEERAAAERGGEIGWLAESQMVVGIRPVVTGLAPGAVSAPVRLDDGWHILKLLEVRPAHKRALSEVRDAIVERLRAERAQANRQAYLARLLEQEPPAINELLLSKVLEPAK